MKMPLLIFCLALAVVLFACASPAAAGVITISSDTTWSSNRYIAYPNSLHIESGVTLTISSGVTVTINNNGMIYNSGTINNHGFINNNKSAINNWNGTINNQGFINNSYFSMIDNDFQGTINNHGFINNNKSTITSWNGNTINNYGFINNSESGISNGGTFNNHGTINNDKSYYCDIFNSGTFNNYGAINNNNHIYNCGYSKATIFNYGTIINNEFIQNGGGGSEGTIHNYGTIINNGTIYNGDSHSEGTIYNYTPCGLINCGPNFKGNPVISVQNNAPQLGTIGDREVNEGALLSITLSASDTEVSDGMQRLTYSTNAPFGTLSDDEFTWTPGYGDAGSYDVEFSVTDGCAVVSEIITITVNDVTNPEEIPEFATIALPVASILGLLFLFNYRKRRKED